jgi:anthranilate phosphoribosyltransferase
MEKTIEKMPSEFTIKDAISKLVSMGGDLSEREAEVALEEIMDGRATPSQIASFLTAVRMKGPSVNELTAFATVMRKHALKISPKVNSKMLVDTCGTGGDKLKTFNISTISTFVTAGAGISVAKHGNRSFTSKCGSADLLERLGVDVSADPQTVQSSIENSGIGFMFAPVFHPSMKHVAAPRKEIGIRTVFNILGPLTNPAGARAQVVGVYEDDLVLPVAQVLRNLGIENATVVHGVDGIDEISIVGKTNTAKVIGDEIREELLEPSSFGLKGRARHEISADGADLETYAITAIRVLAGNQASLTTKEAATKEMVLMNSSAAIVTAKKTDDFKEGIELARNSIESGRAFDKLMALVKYSNGDLDRIESLLKISG